MAELVRAGDLAHAREARSGAEAVRLLLTAAVMMGDIGEEITEIELEPLPEEVPAEAPAEPVTEPVPA